MSKPLRLVDADRHVVEPTPMWREYLEPPWKEGAPYEQLPHESIAERMERLGPKALVPPMPTLMLDGKPAWRGLSERALVEMSWTLYQRRHSPALAMDPHAQLRSMEDMGVEQAFLFPTHGLFLLRMDAMEPARAAAFARAYNSWLHDYCQPAPERLRGVGALSLHDPVRALAELERVAAWGWRAVVVPPNPVQGRTLGHPAYAPLWSACERHGLALAIHEGTHVRLPQAGADRFHSRFALNAASHPLEQMMALLSLLEAGVLERHPRLRVGLFEAGCSWVPYWLWQLDESYKYMQGEVAEHVCMPPSGYFRRQCFVSVEPGEPLLPEVVREIGAESLLFGSDFPHADHEGEAGEAVETLRARLPEDAVRQLLWDNPARFYGLTA